MESGRREDPWERCNKLLSSALEMVARGARTWQQWYEHLLRYQGIGDVVFSGEPEGETYYCHRSTYVLMNCLRHALSECDYQNWGDHLHEFVFGQRRFRFIVNFDDRSDPLVASSWSPAPSEEVLYRGIKLVTAVLEEFNNRAPDCDEVVQRAVSRAWMMPVPAIMVAFSRAFPRVQLKLGVYGLKRWPERISGRPIYHPAILLYRGERRPHMLNPDHRFHIGCKFLMVTAVDEPPAIS